MSEPLAHLEFERSESAVRISVAGEIELSNAEELKDRLEQATADAGSVVVDLTRVTFIDSRGIRLLIHLSRRLEAAGAELTLVAPPESIAGGVLRLTPVPELRLADR
jgi:anti-sigma B factor antagonist